MVDVVAAHNPDNAFLGDLSTVLSAASLVTPQGGAKKIVGEGLEVAITQAEHHADDIADAVVDVAKAVPTPPTQLAQDVANSAMAKIPNAPPGALPVPRNPDFTPAVKRSVYNDAIAPDGNLYCTYCGSRIYIQEGRTLKGDIIPPNRAQMDHKIPIKLGGDGSPENAAPACRLCNGMSGKGDARGSTCGDGCRVVCQNCVSVPVGGRWGVWNKPQMLPFPDSGELFRG